MAQKLFGKELDEKIHWNELQNRIVRRSQTVTSAPREETGLTKVTFDDQSFLVCVPRIVKKETEKAVDIYSKRKIGAEASSRAP